MTWATPIGQLIFPYVIRLVFSFFPANYIFTDQGKSLTFLWTKQLVVELTGSIFSFQWPWHTPWGRYRFLLFLRLNKEYLSICTPKEGFAEAYFDPDPLCPVWHDRRDKTKQNISFSVLVFWPHWLQETHTSSSSLSSEDGISGASFGLDFTLVEFALLAKNCHLLLAFLFQGQGGIFYIHRCIAHFQFIWKSDILFDLLVDYHREHVDAAVVQWLACLLLSNGSIYTTDQSFSHQPDQFQDPRIALVVSYWGPCIVSPDQAVVFATNSPCFVYQHIYWLVNFLKQTNVNIYYPHYHRHIVLFLLFFHKQIILNPYGNEVTFMISHFKFFRTLFKNISMNWIRFF